MGAEIDGQAGGSQRGHYRTRRGLQEERCFMSLQFAYAVLQPLVSHLQLKECFQP